jgi:hypothetical protein
MREDIVSVFLRNSTFPKKHDQIWGLEPHAMRDNVPFSRRMLLHGYHKFRLVVHELLTIARGKPRQPGSRGFRTPLKRCQPLSASAWGHRKRDDNGRRVVSDLDDAALTDPGMNKRARKGVVAGIDSASGSALRRLRSLDEALAVDDHVGTRAAAIDCNRTRKLLDDGARGAAVPNVNRNEQALGEDSGDGAIEGAGIKRDGLNAEVAKKRVDPGIGRRAPRKAREYVILRKPARTSRRQDVNAAHKALAIRIDTTCGIPEQPAYCAMGVNVGSSASGRAARKDRGFCVAQSERAFGGASGVEDDYGLVVDDRVSVGAHDG